MSTRFITTEHDWLTCDDPQRMLESVRNRLNDRKLRLFAVACCRRIWPLFTHEHMRLAVIAAERHADGAASDVELPFIGLGARATELSYIARAAESVASRYVGHAAEDTARNAARGAADIAAKAAGFKFDLVAESYGDVAAHEMADIFRAPHLNSETKLQATLFRDIIGNLWKPVTLSPNIRAAAQQLAQAAYDERRDDGSLDPARLLVLADALEENGCTEASVLAALREPVTRWRGFWALDIVLGLE